MADREMNVIPLGYIGWFLAVTGATISSLPQWWVVALQSDASGALFVGLPILLAGAILLVVAWMPERKRRLPEVLETTMTPIPKFYLEFEEELP